MPRCYLVKKEKYYSSKYHWEEQEEDEEYSEFHERNEEDTATILSIPQNLQAPTYENGPQSYAQPGPQARMVNEPQVIKNESVRNSDGGIPIFRVRTAEETEIAQDLLQLSRSLPPKPQGTINPVANPVCYTSPHYAYNNVLSSVPTPPHTPNCNNNNNSYNIHPQIETNDETIITASTLNTSHFEDLKPTSPTSYIPSQQNVIYQVTATSRKLESSTGHQIEDSCSSSNSSNYQEVTHLTPLVPPPVPIVSSSLVSNSQVTFPSSHTPEPVGSNVYQAIIHSHTVNTGTSGNVILHGVPCNASAPTRVIVYRNPHGGDSNATVPLTPSTSEYSSDAENICPSDETLEGRRIDDHGLLTEDTEYKLHDLSQESYSNHGDMNRMETVDSDEERSNNARRNYTYEDLLHVDGRSKRKISRNQNGSKKNTSRANNDNNNHNSRSTSCTNSFRLESTTVQNQYLWKKSRRESESSISSSSSSSVLVDTETSKSRIGQTNRRSSARLQSSVIKSSKFVGGKRKSPSTRSKLDEEKSKKSKLIKTTNRRGYSKEEVEEEDDLLEEKEDKAELDDDDYDFEYRNENKNSKNRYSCSQCGKHYATSSNLSRHKQTHRSLDSHNAKHCPTCGKKYVSMPALSMHLLTHNLTHKCDVCGKGFSRPWLLQGHKRSHTGEKPYGCAHCGKAFADRSNLRAHMQTHSTKKTFVCKRCNKSFALKSYLNKHYDSSCYKELAGSRKN